MRNHPRGEKTYLEFLEEIKVNSIKAFENQDLPFEELVNKLNIERDLSGNPLFDVSIGVNNYEPGKQKTTETTFIPYQSQDKKSRFYMTLFASDFNLEYCTHLFKPSTIEKMAERFIEIIKQVVENKNIQLKDVCLSHEKEDLQMAAEGVSEIEFGF